MKKTFKEKVTSLGLNYNVEIAIIIAVPLVFILGGIAIYFFLKELYVAIGVGMVGVAFSVMYSTRYSSIQKRIEKDHVDELISLLSYFEMFISNGNNVYTSFKLLLPYCSIFMEDAINSLIASVDVDKTVGPFINFASKFNDRIIESLMLSVYQMVDNGEGANQFSEFELLFTNIREKYQEDLIDSKKKSLDTLNSFPLFGAGAITIALSVTIISLIGDFIDVI